MLEKRDQLANYSVKKWNLFLPALLCLCLLGSCSENKTTANKAKQKTEQLQKSEEQQSNTDADKVIVFFGNSLTAGYQLKEEEAFPYLIQSMLDSLSLDYKTVNAGLSGETTAGGDRRIEWVLKQPMDVFFLELGGNDMLRGTDLEATEENLRSIVRKVRQAHPDIPILLAGMLAPPNLGKTYSDQFSNIYKNLAAELDLTLIPFFLKDVAGVAELNLKDGIHPNSKGHQIVAKTVWSHLYPLLKN